MKTKFICLLLPFALIGCSRKEPGANEQRVTASRQSSRPKVSFVESMEIKAGEEIHGQALALLTNGDYAGLEALAAKYRASKERRANGIWKLASVYNGLEPSERSPDATWQARLKQVEQWIKTRPETAMPRIVLARILTGYAWEARGSDWADKVKEKNWAPFFARLNKALVCLKEAKHLKEQCPVYWSSMQQIALGLQFSRKQYDALFAQAIQEYPDYDYYYSARAYYLLPRWYGEEGEWEMDLSKWADRIGGEAGDVLYARVVWHITSGMASEISKGFRANKSSWERVDRGFGVIVEKFPDSLAAKNQRACLAAMAGDRDKAQSYFLQGQGQVESCEWQKKEVERFLDWTFGP